MVRVTGNFSSEGPLHPAALDALLAAFEQGWADPKKLTESSAKAAILRDGALATISTRLNLPQASLEIIGEPALGSYLSIAGLLRPESTFFYGATDKGKVRAIARAHTGPVIEIPVNTLGELEIPQEIVGHSVLSLQSANSETGAIQDLENFVDSATDISIDATASGVKTQLPSRWATALFDATSWSGPSGLAILAINNDKVWKYPLPHIAPIRSPGSYSLPLLLAAAVALDEFTYDQEGLHALQQQLITGLTSIPGIRYVLTHGAPNFNSFLVDGVANEQLIRALSERGISIDGGSACNPEDLQPSHVIAAMGYPTHGHIRITLHSDTTKSDIDLLLSACLEIIPALRR